MIPIFLSRHDGGQQWFPAAALAFLLCLPGTAALAHGPDGDHDHADTAAATETAGTAPRMEAHSETFELVARLRGNELSMFINRFETNEPVLEARVEVESGALKAAAKFHSDMGDYAIDDPAFLKALQAPGAHPLVITVLADKESDLLEGSLQTDAVDATDAPGPSIPQTAWAVLAMAALAATGFWLNRRARTRPSETQGEIR